METALRHRRTVSVERPSTEEALIEKLDSFLSSIEHRLEKFEQYFKVAEDASLWDDSKDHVTSRRSSSASATSLCSYYNLNKIHEQLVVVKDHVLRTSVTNLDYLYKILDDKCNYLFNLGGEHVDTCGGGSSKEILSTNIINTIQYFEQRLNHIDQLIKSRTPQATAHCGHDDKFARFRFFNFNKAVQEAQTRNLHYYQLPLNWRENRYIIHGYRFSLHHRDMLRSIFQLNHNEAGNIWTHMLGGIVVLWLGAFHFPRTAVFTANSLADNLVMYMFLAAALKCFVSSVFWHTYSGFAHASVRSRFACIDYTGITVLITCSVISVEYCGLANYPKLLGVYVGFSVLCGAALLFFNWSSFFDRPECRPLRIGLFVSLALLGGTAVLCKAAYEGFGAALYFYAPIAYYSLVWYWVGVIFYGGLIPERWRYDVIINEDPCHHSHTSSDVLTGHVENSGVEEMEEMEEEMEELEELEQLEEQLDEVEEEIQQLQELETMEEVIQELAETENMKANDQPFELRSEEPFPHLDAFDSPTPTEDPRYREILEKHFPREPVKTPYHKDFMSLWWVDYVMNSHNIWHIFVVLGAVGHYATLVRMFGAIARN